VLKTNGWPRRKTEVKIIYAKGEELKCLGFMRTADSLSFVRDVLPKGKTG